MRLPRRSIGRATAALALVAMMLPLTGVFAQESGASVAIQNFAFTAKELHVAPGTTVTWTNLDQLQHTVTADDGSFDSGFLDPGASFQFTFAQPGTYLYYCMPHGGPHPRNCPARRTVIARAVAKSNSGRS